MAIHLSFVVVSEVRIGAGAKLILAVRTFTSTTKLLANVVE